MKKFLSLLLCLISVLCFVGCTTEQPGVDPVSPAPWAHTGNSATAYEKMVYQIKKYDKTKNNAVIAEGVLSFELAPVTGETDDNELSTLTTAFTLTYNDNASSLDKGKTDTILSTATFVSTTLMPVSSTKIVTLADRADITNESYTLTNDYKGGKSTLVMPGRDLNSTINFAGANLLDVYDNDTIYHYLRAYPDMKNSISGRFKVTDFFDMHFRGSYSPIRLTFVTGDATTDTTVNIGSALSEKYLGDKTGNVTAIRAEFSLEGENTGTPETLYFAKTPFVIEKATTAGGKDKTTSLVLVKIVENEYDYNSATVQFVTEYTLIDYATAK